MTVCEEKYEAIQEMITGERHNEAMQALETLVDECDDYAPAHFDLGNLYYASGEMEKALAHYEKTMALMPDNPLYLKNLADLLYSESKDTDRALTLYEKILSLRPKDVQVLMLMGHLCVSLERFDQALKYYSRVLDIEPWNDEAQQFIDKIMAKGTASDADPETIYQHCQDLVSRGLAADATTSLESLVSKHPDFALAHNDLGVLYFQQGKKARCLQSYEKAVAIEPGNPNFQKNLADFYLVEQGDVEKALGIYFAVLSENPEDIDALMVAGHICATIGKTESAMTFYERVLDIEPWNMDASERLEALQNQSA
jgi:tetratricopeptide (TPR) repeat protein